MQSFCINKFEESGRLEEGNNGSNRKVVRLLEHYTVFVYAKVSSWMSHEVGSA